MVHRLTVRCRCFELEITAEVSYLAHKTRFNARPIAGEAFGVQAAVLLEGSEQEGIAAGLVVAADIAIVAVTMSTVRPTVDDVVIGDDAWLAAIRNVAAADTVAAMLAILLAVLVFRMPLDRWARGLVGAIAITTAVLATGSAAGSAGTLDFLQSERPVVVPRGWTGGTVLDLGRTPDGGLASIDRSLDATPIVSRRISRVEQLAVPGTMSIADLVSAPIPD